MQTISIDSTATTTSCDKRDKRPSGLQSMREGTTHPKECEEAWASAGWHRPVAEVLPFISERT
jgi:hypothetical protein